MPVMTLPSLVATSYYRISSQPFLDSMATTTIAM